MIIFDGYYVLFIAALCVLALSLVHSTRIFKHLPDRAVIVTMTSVTCVCAYNYEIGNYAESMRIENGGYFALAVLVTMFFVHFGKDLLIFFIGAAAFLVFITAGMIGGIDYGSAWLRDEMDMSMTTNAFIMVIVAVVVLFGLLYWRLSEKVYFKWLVSVCVICVSDAMAFSVLVGRIGGWYNDTGDTYEVLDFSQVALYLMLAISWYIVPAYLTFNPKPEGTPSEKQSLVQVKVAA